MIHLRSRAKVTLKASEKLDFTRLDRINLLDNRMENSVLNNTLINLPNASRFY